MPMRASNRSFRAWRPLALASLLAAASAAAPALAQDASAAPSPTPEPAAAPAPAAPPAAAAGAPVVSTVPNEALPPSALPVKDNVIQLSLQDAVATAMQRNLGLLVERFDREQFHLQIGAAMGIYDLGLAAQAYDTSQAQPSTSQLSGALVLTSKQTDVNSGLSQLTPWGGTATLGFDLFRQESNSRFSSINPYYSSTMELGVSQPLLRNFGKTATERGIRVARINSAISHETFESQVTATLEQVEDAYWNLVGAIRQEGVAEEALALARELHHQNQVRVDVGTLAPLELVQSEAGIATREQDIILAQAAVQAAEDNLRQLLHLEEGNLWSLRINPTTPPETTSVDIDLQQALSTALDQRPELRTQKLAIDLRADDVRYYHNQMLPRLDLSAHYGYAGTGGTVVVRDAEGNVVQVIPGGASDAISQMRDRNFNNWRVQLDFAYPLQNRTARARYAIANVNLEQGKTQLDQLEETIRTEVRQAVRQVRTAAQEIVASTASRRLAEKNLEAERKRYENGLSTSFQVLIIQEDLTTARSKEVSAIAGYRRALAGYYRATGMLTEHENVQLEDPMAADHLSRYGWAIDGDLPFVSGAKMPPPYTMEPDAPPPPAPATPPPTGP